MNGAEKGMPILQVEGLKKSFGKLEVLRGIDEQIREGEASTPSWEKRMAENTAGI